MVQVVQVFEDLKQQVRDLKDDLSGNETSTSSTYSASVASGLNMILADEDLGETSAHHEPYSIPTKADNQNTMQNSEEFQLVLHAKRRRTSVDLNTPAITTSNSFNPLNNAAPSTSGAADNTATPDNTKKPRSPPPVFLKSTEQWLEVAAAISSRGIHIKSTRTTPDAIRIQPTTPEDYTHLNKLLVEMKSQFFTFRLPHEKPIQVVIRGLHRQGTPDSIKAELQALGHPVISVYRLRETSLMTVNLKRCEEAKRIYSVYRLNYLAVKVETKRRNNEPKQCHNYHRFNHTAGAAKSARPKKTTTTRAGVSYAKALAGEPAKPSTTIEVTPST
ncbi:hypothetical protein CBL_05152 [Carabus blaptoides fortunei]